MFHLRAFVSERLSAAAVDIFGEVEKSLSLYQVEVSRSREEIILLRQQLELLRDNNTEPLQDHKYISPVLQENSQGPPGTPEVPVDEEEETEDCRVTEFLPGPSEKTEHDVRTSCTVTEPNPEMPQINKEPDQFSIEMEVCPTPDGVKSKPDDQDAAEIRSPQEVTMAYITNGNRGGKVLIYNNYRYIRGKTATDRIYWRCARKGECRTNLLTNVFTVDSDEPQEIRILSKEPQHRHAGETELVQRSAFTHRVLTAVATNPLISLNRVYTYAVSNALVGEGEIIREYKSLRTMLNRERSRHLPKIPSAVGEHCKYILFCLFSQLT